MPTDTSAKAAPSGTMYHLTRLHAEFQVYVGQLSGWHMGSVRTLLNKLGDTHLKESQLFALWGLKGNSSITKYQPLDRLAYHYGLIARIPTILDWDSFVKHVDETRPWSVFQRDYPEIPPSPFELSGQKLVPSDWVSEGWYRKVLGYCIQESCLLNVEAKIRKSESVYYGMDTLPRNLAPEFVGRTNWFQRLNESYYSQIAHIHIYQSGGAGKSSLVRRYIERLYFFDVNPKIVFAWSFYSQGLDNPQATSTAFFTKLFRELSPNHTYLIQESDPFNVALRAFKLISSSSFILVLDGLEVFQAGSVFRDSALKYFLEMFQEGSLEKSLLISTSRLPISFLSKHDFFCQYKLGSLKYSECKSLLLQRGLDTRSLNSARDRTNYLRQIIEYFKSEPLALILFCELLKRDYPSKRDPLKGDLAFWLQAREKLDAMISTFTDSETNLGSLTFSQRRLNGLLHYNQSNEKNLNSLQRGILYIVSLLDRECLIDSELVSMLSQMQGMSKVNVIEVRREIEWLNQFCLVYRSENSCGTHPNIRSFYFEYLRRNDFSAFSELNRIIATYFRNQYRLLDFDYTQRKPDIESMQPIIRAIYHYSLAKEGNEAYQTFNVDAGHEEFAFLEHELRALYTSRSIYAWLVPLFSSDREPDILFKLLIAYARLEMMLGQAGRSSQLLGEAGEVMLKMSSKELKDLAFEAIIVDSSKVNLFLGKLDSAKRHMDTFKISDEDLRVRFTLYSTLISILRKEYRQEDVFKAAGIIEKYYTQNTQQIGFDGLDSIIFIRLVLFCSTLANSPFDERVDSADLEQEAEYSTLLLILWRQIHCGCLTYSAKDAKAARLLSEDIHQLNFYAETRGTQDPIISAIVLIECSYLLITVFSKAISEVFLKHLESLIRLASLFLEALDFPLLETDLELLKSILTKLQKPSFLKSSRPKLITLRQKLIQMNYQEKLQLMEALIPV